MARPRKKPDYDPEKLKQKLLDAVVEGYLSPPAGTEDGSGHMQLKLLAEEFSITPIKVRKLLITAGAYETPTSLMVAELYANGKSLKEIQAITGLSAASVSGYLPYQKTIYKMDELSVLAERLKRYRERKTAVEELKEIIASEELAEIEEAMWQTIKLFEGYSFRTVKGLNFSYKVKGYEIFVNRKEKSITKASVDIAIETILKLQEEGRLIKGPKMLGCFGASYLYPMFVRFGIVTNDIVGNEVTVDEQYRGRNSST